MRLIHLASSSFLTFTLWGCASFVLLSSGLIVAQAQREPPPPQPGQAVGIFVAGELIGTHQLPDTRQKYCESLQNYLRAAGIEASVKPLSDSNGGPSRPAIASLLK